MVRLLILVVFLISAMDVTSQVPGMYLAPKDSCSNALRELARNGGHRDEFIKIQNRCKTINRLLVQTCPGCIDIGVPKRRNIVKGCRQKWGTWLKPQEDGKQLSMEYCRVFEENSGCYLNTESSKSLGPVIPNANFLPIQFSVSKRNWDTSNFVFGYNEKPVWGGEEKDKTEDYYHGIITVSDNESCKVYFGTKGPVDLGISGKQFIKKDSAGTWDWVDNSVETFFLTLAQLKLKHPNLKFERPLNDKRRAIVYTGSELIALPGPELIALTGPELVLSGYGKYFNVISEPEESSNYLTSLIYPNGSPIPALKELMDDYMKDGVKRQVIMTFSGRIQPRSLQRPEDAWQGINGDCIGNNCSLICSDGSFYPKGSNLGSGKKADWFNEVESIPGPWMRILAITDPGSKLKYSKEDSTAIIVTSNSTDLYRLDFKGSSMPNVRPVYKGEDKVNVTGQEDPEMINLILEECRKNNWQLVNKVFWKN